jgi:telomerase protein component 1
MQADCSTAKGLGALKKLDEVGILLGLMCKYICEDCDFRIFCSSSNTRPKCHVPVELKEGSILDNMKVVKELALKEFANEQKTEFPFDYLEDLILAEKKIDNFIILSHTLIAPGHAEMASGSVDTITNILLKYRQAINPDLLFVRLVSSS